MLYQPLMLYCQCVVYGFDFVFLFISYFYIFSQRYYFIKRSIAWALQMIVHIWLFFNNCVLAFICTLCTTYFSLMVATFWVVLFFFSWIANQFSHQTSYVSVQFIEISVHLKIDLLSSVIDLIEYQYSLDADWSEGEEETEHEWNMQRCNCFVYHTKNLNS